MARLAESPALVRWTTVSAQRQQVARLERARRIPDLTVLAGVRRFSDLDGSAFLLGASLSLPLFDRNGGAIREADARLAKFAEQRRAAATATTLALAEAHRALEAAYHAATVTRDSVLPGAEEALAAVGEGYRLGKFGYLDVLDVQRTLNEARSRYLRALTDYHIAVAELERLIGAPLHRPPTPARPASQE
jgi:cobalt-zinc-cadmium efflux system outer membrane protein